MRLSRKWKSVTHIRFCTNHIYAKKGENGQRWYQYLPTKTFPLKQMFDIGNPFLSRLGDEFLIRHVVYGFLLLSDQIRDGLWNINSADWAFFFSCSGFLVLQGYYQKEQEYNTFVLIRQVNSGQSKKLSLRKSKHITVPCTTLPSSDSNRHETII